MNLKRYFLQVHTPFSVPCALALMLGIWWHVYGAWYSAALVWLLCAIFFTTAHAAYLKRWLLIGLFFGVGFFVHAHQQRLYVEFHHNVQGKVFDMRGVVVEMQPLRKRWQRQMIKLSVEKLREKGDSVWEPCSATVQFYLTNRTPLRVRDTVELYNVSFKALPSESFSAYLIKEGVYATVFLTKPDYRVLKRQLYSLQRFISEKRQQVFESCRNKLSRASFSLFSIIFLGNKTIDKEYLDEQQSYFRLWGLSHYLARAGLHLILLLVLFRLFFSIAPLSFFLKQLMLFAIVIVYSLLSWSSISYLRAFLALFLYTCCSIAELPIQLVHLIALITILVLVFNPSQLFFLDFQLSFGLTFALAWLNHIKKHRKALQT